MNMKTSLNTRQSIMIRVRTRVPPGGKIGGKFNPQKTAEPPNFENKTPQFLKFINFRRFYSKVRFFEADKLIFLSTKT